MVVKKISITWVFHILIFKNLKSDVWKGFVVKRTSLIPENLLFYLCQNPLKMKQLAQPCSVTLSSFENQFFWVYFDTTSLSLIFQSAARPLFLSYPSLNLNELYVQTTGEDLEKSTPIWISAKEGNRLDPAIKSRRNANFWGLWARALPPPSPFKSD